MTRECKVCGKSFEPVTHNHKYCSDSCKKIGYSQVRKAYAESERGQQVYQKRLQKVKKERRAGFKVQGKTLVEIDGKSLYLKLSSFPGTRDCELAHDFCFGCPYRDCIR